MALRLLIESSLSGFGIGLSRIEDAGREFSLQACLLNPKQNSSADSLASGVQSLFQDKDLPWSELEEVFVSHGPGSFTGIRIGLAYVYGLLTALPSLRVQGICGLSMLREALLAGEEPSKATGSIPEEFHILLPQTQSHGFSFGSKDLYSSPNILSYQDLVKYLQGREGKQLLFIPDLRFAKEVRELCEAAAVEVLFLAPERMLLMSLQGMAKIARISQNQRTLPTPQYRRLSSAEERLKLLESSHER